MVHVAMLADYLEEGWTSMDHYAAKLVEALADHPRFDASIVRPPFLRRVCRLPQVFGPRRSEVLDRIANRYFDYPKAASGLRGYELFHVLDQTYAHVTRHLPTQRTVVTCHDLDFFDPPPSTRHAWMVRWTGSVTLPGLQRAARIICDSEAIRNEIATRGLVPPERLAVVPLGVEGMFRPEGARALARAAEVLLKGLDDRPLLLHVGGMAPRKRIDLLLRCFARIRSQIPAAMLIRVGGALSPQLKHLAETLGLERAIIEMPFLSRADLAALYRRVDLLILTSETEGFGLPVLEAMASSVPVVSRNLPAVREVSADAVLFVAGEDVEAYAAACLHVLRDDGVRDGMKSRGLARAAPFTWERTGEMTGRIYQEVLDALV